MEYPYITKGLKNQSGIFFGVFRKRGDTLDDLQWKSIDKWMKYTIYGNPYMGM